tara:strand:+ start:12372 stop:13301 length:930 start_codon:yes stop_codon:yes gene_type:complete
MSDYIASLKSNNISVISRLISNVENDSENFDQLLNELYPHSQETFRIGITGPPGAGKSTLLNQLIIEFRKKDKSIGIISVDPTSPITGGALLGDRVRMTQHFDDDKVFIRSMGSRGAAGGLALKSQLVAEILSATGKDILFIETIGIGQTESDIFNQVDLTILVLVPESGDDVQMIKAGPIEIADILVVNKSDRPNADHLTNTLLKIFTNNNSESDPGILNTSALTGEGVDLLVQNIISQLESLTNSGKLNEQREKQYIEKVKETIKDEFMERFWYGEMQKKIGDKVKEFKKLKISPYNAAKEIITELI